MSAESIQKCAINYSGLKLTQNLGNGEATILNLPQDLIWRIMRTLGDENSRLKAAINLVDFGRVCKHVHWMTHEDSEVDALLHDEEKFKPFVDFFHSNQMNHPSTMSISPIIYRCLLRGTDIYEEFKNYKQGRPDKGFANWVKYTDALFNFLLKDAANERNISQVIHAIFKKGHNIQETSSYIKRSKKVADLLSPNEASRRLFLDRIYHDLIDYRLQSSNPIKNNIKEYKDLVARLKKDYPDIPVITHEKHLRQALCQKYKIRLEAERDAYANPSEELLTKVKDMLKEDREVQLRGLIFVATHLFGTDGSDGEIHASEVRMRDAHAKMLKAKENYLLELEEHRKFVMDSSKAEDLINSEDQTHSHFTQFASVVQEYQSTSRSLELQKRKLAEIGVWTKDGIQNKGPKYLEIEESLVDTTLVEDAWSECAKISAFFDQLTKPIGDQNEIKMFQLLHGIIG
jgi:hypothetical protein